MQSLSNKSKRLSQSQNRVKVISTVESKLKFKSFRFSQRDSKHILFIRKMDFFFFSKFDSTFLGKQDKNDFKVSL